VALGHSSGPKAWLARNDYTVQVGKGSKRSYNEQAMASLLRAMTPGLVVLERQRAMPRQGAPSAYTIGLGEGIWRGVLAALELSYEVTRPQDWQRVVFKGMPGDGKGRALLVAARRLPALDLAPGRRVKHHDGIADAGCMALYGQTRLGGYTQEGAR